jgi:nitrite reductase/ring-hydroxylating ferredoxin subunit
MAVREPKLVQVRTPVGTGAFARADVTVASWYCVGKGRALKPGAVSAAQLGETKLAVWRGDNSRVLAMDARCPHLGADLTQGRVVHGQVVCPMHAWKMGPGGGGCERGLLPTLEHHGLIFVHAGAVCVASRDRITSPNGEENLGRPWLLPPQTIRTSGHLVLGNGFDTGHYGPLHGVELIDAKRVEEDGAVYAVDIRARLVRKRRWRALGLTGREVVARFIGVGAGLTWVSCEAPLRFSVLFSATPLRAKEGGGCRTRVAFFPARGPAVAKLRALGLMYGLVCDDRRVLEGMRFRPNWTAADACLRGYAEMIDGLPHFGGGAGACG